MNNKILLLVPLSLLFSACETERGLVGCPEGSQPTNRMTLIPAANAGIEAVPPDICVAVGTTVTINIPAADVRGSVATRDTAEIAPWLNGSNSERASRIRLYVNRDVAVGDYKFDVFWQGKDKLDPRVSVRTEDR